ncbi:hypothetical protein Poly51_47190 [Rubripirellula tenax]|uniref:VWFA domain-containing protein n=1 Tax=Rubripirellula tenax TaxID=2528015 RepID=A0A5C6EK56_9BACT|nr:BatA domain-containing protein [Rubripirellula tenax]TWU48815.1 hypothetical protein Poly51_47190 [Rubripirellula tenax]
MSLLAPLFFAGALAVGLPILFHLIRRRPKSEVQFSSLMFLDPTPPRLTRRSRLDHLPLLIIRSLALILLAAAFARPFFRSVDLADNGPPPRRIVVLLDTSASMQRSGMWTQARQHVNEVLEGVEGQDRIALMTFDRRPTVRVRFDQSAKLDVAARRQLVQSSLTDLRPTWFQTDMASALSVAADVAVAENDAESPQDKSDPGSIPPVTIGDATVILVSDMQSGSSIEKLQSFAWPDGVRVEVRRVLAEQPSNAVALLMEPATGDASEAVTNDATNSGRPRVRVRISNSIQSSVDSFLIGWNADVPVQVPPGQTRVVQIDAPDPSTKSLKLSGDQCDFDNFRYISIDPPMTQTIAFMGKEAAEARSSLLYYLKRAPLNNPSRTVSVETLAIVAEVAELDPLRTPLLVLAQPIDSDFAIALKAYANRGGQILVVMDDAKSIDGMAATLSTISGDSLSISEAEVRDYQMFGRIDFSDPAFRSMADPQFNDFTKIRFWTHRRVSGLSPSWSIGATFDNGDPAIARLQVGKGSITLLSFGWQPESSELALSTKFVPMVSGWMGRNDNSIRSFGYTIGQPIPIAPSPTATISTPSGQVVAYKTQSDLDIIEEPGIYAWSDGTVSQRIAMNVAESESQIDPIGDEVLEQFGVVLSREVDTVQADASERQMRDLELEGRQNLWRWMIVAALGLLGVETWWGGRLSRRAGSAVADGGLAN